MKQTSAAPAKGFSQSTMATDGAQSIQRALRVLKLAVAAQEGITLTQVVQASGLTKPTAHRILAALVEEGFLAVEDGSRTYRPGTESLALGLSASKQNNVKQLAQDALHRLASITQNTVYLSAPSGWESICLDCVVGSYPIRILTLDIGDRRPLGISAGGLALLAFRGQEEIDTILRDSPHLPYPGISVQDIRDDVRDARASGYALFAGRIIPEMTGVGLPVYNREGQLIAALSIASLTSRLQGAELEKTVKLLRTEAEKLSELEYEARRG